MAGCDLYEVIFIAMLVAAVGFIVTAVGFMAHVVISLWREGRMQAGVSIEPPARGKPH